MKRINKYLKIVLLVTITIVCFHCKKEIKPESIRVTVNSWVGFGPLYVAKEKGIFENYGLNVDIIKLENAPDRRAALIAKRIEILGSTLDDLAVTLSQGIDAVAFACADFSNGSDGIVVAEGINTLNDLVKIPIAAQPGFVNHFFLLYVLDKNGIPIDNIRINPMTPDDAGAAFISGNIDAAVTWEPWLSQAIEKRENSKIIASSKDYPEAIIDLFVSNREWFNNNREIIANFKNSWDESLLYIKDNEEVAYIIIGKELGIDPSEVGDMLAGAYLLSSKEGYELLEGKIATLSERVERIWRKAGYVDNDINLKESVLLDTTYIQSK